MSIGTILIVILIVLLIGGVAGPGWGWQPGYGAGWYGNGGIGVVLLIVIILLVLGEDLMGMTRGKTFKPKGNPAKRPPKLSGRVANDVYANPARSMMSPPPTKDTQEPKGRGLTKGRRR